MKRELMRRIASDRVERLAQLRVLPKLDLLREQYIDQQMRELEAVFGKPEAD